MALSEGSGAVRPDAQTPNRRDAAVRYLSSSSITSGQDTGLDSRVAFPADCALRAAADARAEDEGGDVACSICGRDVAVGGAEAGEKGCGCGQMGEGGGAGAQEREGGGVRSIATGGWVGGGGRVGLEGGGTTGPSERAQPPFIHKL